MTLNESKKLLANASDFYFRLTKADGSSLDTLQLGTGFFKNFQSARIGTPASPFTITFGGVGLIVADPG